MNNFTTRFFLATLFVFSTIITWAQGTVRGNVYEKSSQSALPFVGVKLSGHANGAVTDLDGFFQINDVAEGTYEVEVSSIGYTTQKRSIQVKSGRIVNLQFYLDESSEVIAQVEVSAEKQVRQTKVLTAVTNLSMKSIQRFSIGGEPDLVRALQVLPGVVTTGDQGGQMYIRGGAPIQNLTLLDGMIVYNPFHSIGFFSVFDTDILRSAEVHSAGFNAEYGGRTSSVLDVKTRAGNRQRISGKVSASTYMAKALLEIPIGKKDRNGFTPTSALVSYKKSFLSSSSKLFYPYVKTEYDGLPFEFEDVYGKFSYQSNSGSEVNFFGFNFTDNVQFAGDKSIGWKSYGYGANFTAVPPSTRVLISGNFAYSNYDIQSNEYEGRPRFSSISGFNGGLEFKYFLREFDELRYGLEVIGYNTNFSYTNSAGRVLKQEQNTSEIGAYLQYKLEAGRFLFEPGFRAHYYSTLAAFRLEPRIGVKYNATDWLRFKGAAGMYSQNLLAATSDRDVVNLFYGFLSAPDEQPYSYDGATEGKRLQTANQYVLGTEIDLSARWTLDLEGYVKDFLQITTVNRNKIYPDDQTYADRNAYLRKSYITEHGLAYGFDVLLKYADRQWNLWGTYSYAKVTRDDGVQTYAPVFDRRHNTNLVGAYKFGKELSWEVNVRWNFGTGFPFTPIAGYYQQLPWTNNQNTPQLDYPYTTENGNVGTLYGDLNSSRLPTYHRMDITVKKSWSFGKYQQVDASLAATNVYNRSNIFYYDTVERKRVNQLPFMPTLIVSYSF